MATNNSTNTSNPITVPQGGTGVATLTTAYGTLCAGTTATGNVQTVSPGTVGQVYTSGGSGALPSFANLPTMTAGLNTGYWKIHIELFGNIGFTTSGSGTSANIADTVHYLPMLIGFPITITDLGINVSATGTATSCIIAVYNSNSAQTQPTGTPITNSTTGSISITGTGVKSATLGTSITLQPGLYFVAFLINGSCTFVAAGANVLIPKFGASTSTGYKVCYYTQSRSFGSGFPTAGSLSENTNSPEFIYIKGNT
jgi:hypothetical protein